MKGAGPAMRRLATVLCLGCTAMAPAAACAAGTLAFRDLAVTVRGEGRPVIMVPGLASSPAVFDELCARLQPGVQCLMVALPGFAGARPASHPAFLEAMRDQLLAFARSRGFGRVSVVGHSLGGVLALMMAVRSDASIDRLAILDAVPFLPAIDGSSPGPGEARAAAARARDATLAASPAEAEAQARAAFPHLVHDPARVETLVEWSRRSDRATVAQAMAELMTTDLRPALWRITRPTLVLGAWAGLAPMGVTRDVAAARFAAQYAKLAGVRIAFSDTAWHFLMWDDPDWTAAQLRAFLVH